MPQKTYAQYQIKCESPTSCDGWIFHKNKMGLGTGWSADKVPRTTLHLHEFNSVNTYLNITNQTTGFPVGSQTIGFFVGMTGNKATISNFQNDNLVLAHGTNEQVVINPLGNMGIGITTPQNVLHVHKSIGTIPQLSGNESTENKSIAASSAYGIQITNQSTGSAAANGLLIGLAANGSARIVQQGALSLSLGVNNTDVVNINPGGNVGIGTANPTAKLHTNGTVRIENLPTATAYANEKIILIDAQGNAKQASANLIGDNLGNHTAGQNIKLNDKWLSNDADNEGIKISNQGDVYISGSLGVGVTSSQAKVHISSSNAPDKQVLLVGNNPQQGEGLAFYNTCDNEHGWIRGEMGFGYKPTSNSWEVTAQYNYGGIRFGGDGIRFIAGTPADGTTPKEAAVISNNGNVGIGIMLPIQKLHIQGNEFINGYLGIGNNNPNNAIDIMGNSVESGQIYIKNTYSVNNNPYSIAKIGAANGKLFVESNKDFIISIDNQGNFANECFKIVNNVTSIATADFTNNELFSISNYDAKLFKTLYFYDLPGNSGKVNVKIDNSNGYITSRKLIIKVTEQIGDFVFEDNYKIPSLYEEENYYKTYKHLKGIPAEKQILNEGMDVDRFVSLLLQKLETSIIQNVQQQKEIDLLKEQVNVLQKQVEQFNK